MKVLFPAVLSSISIIAGGIGAHFLNGAPHPGRPLSSPAPTEVMDFQSTGADEARPVGSSAIVGSTDQTNTLDSSDAYYYKFSREFVVPQLEGGRVRSLIILNISLEANSNVSESLFSIEPRLRDNIMTTLIALSGDGVTFDSINSVESYETMRSLMLQNIKQIAPNVENVLILDMAKQDL